MATRQEMNEAFGRFDGANSELSAKREEADEYRKAFQGFLTEIGKIKLSRKNQYGTEARRPITVLEVTEAFTVGMVERTASLKELETQVKLRQGVYENARKNLTD